MQSIYVLVQIIILTGILIIGLYSIITEDMLLPTNENCMQKESYAQTDNCAQVGNVTQEEDQSRIMDICNMFSEQGSQGDGPGDIVIVDVAYITLTVPVKDYPEIKNREPDSTHT